MSSNSGKYTLGISYSSQATCLWQTRPQIFHKTTTQTGLSFSLSVWFLLWYTCHSWKEWVAGTSDHQPQPLIWFFKDLSFVPSVLWKQEASQKVRLLHGTSTKAWLHISNRHSRPPARAWCVQTCSHALCLPPSLNPAPVQQRFSQGLLLGVCSP